MSKKKTEIKIEYPFTMLGKKYKHINGEIYTAFDITNTGERKTSDEQFPVTVIYFDKDGNKWSRPLSSWERSLTELETDEEGNIKK